MTRSKKNLLIWASFGLMLGSLLAKAIIKPELLSYFDWFLIGLGVIIAFVHYTPDKIIEKESP